MFKVASSLFGNINQSAQTHMASSTAPHQEIKIHLGDQNLHLLITMIFTNYSCLPSLHTQQCSVLLVLGCVIHTSVFCVTQSLQPVSVAEHLVANGNLYVNKLQHRYETILNGIQSIRDMMHTQLWLSVDAYNLGHPELWMDIKKQFI